MLFQLVRFAGLGIPRSGIVPVSLCLGRSQVCHNDTNGAVREDGAILGSGVFADKNGDLVIGKPGGINAALE